MKYILASLLAAVFWYIIAAFIVADINAFNWGDDRRKALVMLWLFSWAVISVWWVSQEFDL